MDKNKIIYKIPKGFLFFTISFFFSILAWGYFLFFNSHTAFLIVSYICTFLAIISIIVPSPCIIFYENYLTIEYALLFRFKNCTILYSNIETIKIINLKHDTLYIRYKRNIDSKMKVRHLNIFTLSYDTTLINSLIKMILKEKHIPSDFLTNEKYFYLRLMG